MRGEALDARLHRSIDPGLFDELVQLDALPLGVSGVHTHFDQRSIDQSCWRGFARA
jgi:hypothetical protein